MPTTFIEATADLSAFDVKDGHNGSWVFREDVAEIGRAKYVRVPPPPGNLQAAERLYLRGIERALGISIEAFAHSSETTYAWVFVPADNTDAEYSMVGGEHLKLAIPEECVSPREIGNSISWWVVRLRESSNRRFKFVDLLPKRAAA